MTPLSLCVSAFQKRALDTIIDGFELLFSCYMVPELLITESFFSESKIY